MKGRQAGRIRDKLLVLENFNLLFGKKMELFFIFFFLIVYSFKRFWFTLSNKYIFIILILIFYFSFVY